MDRYCQVRRWARRSRSPKTHQFLTRHHKNQELENEYDTIGEFNVHPKAECEAYIDIFLHSINACIYYAQTV